MNWYAMKPGPEREAAKARSEAEIASRPKRLPFDPPIKRVPGQPAWIGPSGIAHPFENADEEQIAKLGAKSDCPPLSREKFRIERIGKRLFILGLASGQRTFVPDSMTTPGLWRITFQHVNQIESASGVVATATDQQTSDKEDKQCTINRE